MRLVLSRCICLLPPHPGERELPSFIAGSAISGAICFCAQQQGDGGYASVIVLIYELLNTPRWASWNAFLSWIWRDAAPALIGGAITAVYVYSKITNIGSTRGSEPYRPIYSWHNFVTSNSSFVGELLYAPQAITPIALLLLWAAVFIYAFFRRDRMLRLMAFWIVIVPLPIAFILPIRGGGCLYLLLFGWAMIFARALCDLIAFVENALILYGQRLEIYRTRQAMLERPSSFDCWGRTDRWNLKCYRSEDSWSDSQDRSSLRVGSFIRTLY
jgi:hypothetical protein